MEGVMILGGALAALVALDVLAYFGGQDSRDGVSLDELRRREDWPVRKE